MQKIDISESLYRIIYDYKLKKYILLRDGNPLVTPDGSVVAHANKKLLQHMESELECRNILDVTELTTYSMFCTWNDLLVKQNIVFTKQDIRNWIISDPILRACAGPEKIDQLYKWSALLEVLEEIDISYPDLVQSMDIEGVEEWISSMGEEYEKSFNKFVDKMYEEFSILSKEQKTAVVNSLNCHSSFCYGLLLATKKCTEIEYANAILAGECLLPIIFADSSRDEYKEAFYHLVLDANIITNFIRFSLEPDKNIIVYIKANLPGYGFLPESAKWSILEACKNIMYAKADDYSPYVVLLGKTIEVSLKKLIFDEYQKIYQTKIYDEKEINLFIKENNKIQKLAKFLVKEPHFIQLGSMLFFLEKYNEDTFNSNELLKKIFDFVILEKDKKSILDESFISEARNVAKMRNEAAHDRRFTLDEARALMDNTMQLLSNIV